MIIQSPQSFVIRSECQKAAWQNGYRRTLEEQEGWAAFASTTAPGKIFIAKSEEGDMWFLALDHRAVVEELDEPQSSVPGPGFVRFSLPSLSALYNLVSRVYQLSASLPDAPLREFEVETQNLPRSTEAERLVIQRVGQDIFRKALLEYWQRQCPLTGISDLSLLRASHIKPWKDCTSDSERLDVHNGLLLSALWDAAFDGGLVTFDNEGHPEFSPSLSESGRAELRWSAPLPLNEKIRQQLCWHRKVVFIQSSR